MIFTKVLELIVQLPGILEFVIGSALYLFIAHILGGVVTEVARGTVCETPGFAADLMCFFYTNPVVAFLLTVGTIVCLGLAFRAKFL